jgi:PAS domain S-box-containing protein
MRWRPRPPGSFLARRGIASAQGEHHWRHRVEIDTVADLVDGLDEALVVVGRRLEVLHWNTALERLTGTARSDALGRRLGDVVPWLAAVGLVSHLERALGGEPSVLEETAREAPAGVRLWVAARCRPLGDARGRIRAAAAFIRDVTEPRDDTRLYADATRRAHRLRDLAAISQSVSATLELRDVMERIAGAAAALVPGALASVHVAEPEHGVLRLAATSAPALPDLPDGQPLHAGLPGLVVERRAPVLVSEPVRHPRVLAPDWWRQRPTASYYGVPILAGDLFLGVLSYIAPAGAPEHEEQEVLGLLAAQAGLAIRNASLYQRERVQSDRIRALAAINQRISRTLELDEPLQTIAEQAAQLTGVRFASFWMADDARRALTLMRGSVPEIAGDVPEPDIGYDGAAVGWVAHHRRPLVVDDVFADSRIAHRE